MTELQPWFGPISLIALAFWLGHSVILRAVRERPRLAESFAAGVLFLHGWLLLVDWLGIRWSFGVILLPAVAALALGWGVKVKDRTGFSAEPWVLGEWLTAACVGVFLWSAVTLRSVSPDFIYHWGFKGRRFFEVSGIDWAVLQRPGSGYLHPDYPLLLPNLSAASAILGGGWWESPLMLWSAVALALLLVEIRGTLVDFAVPATATHLTLMTAACALTAFSVAHLQAGAADIQFALCLLVLSRECVRVVASETGALPLWRVGLWAALALATKIEGAPLAAFAVLSVIGLILTRSRESAGRRALAAVRAWPLWGPVAFFGGWWLLSLERLGLFQESNMGIPTLDRIDKTLNSVPSALSGSSWTGFGWLILILPLLFFARRTRALVWLAILQLGFYFASYFGGEQDTVFWVLSSLPRLVFHLMPVILVGIGIQVAFLGIVPETPRSPPGGSG